MNVSVIGKKGTVWSQRTSEVAGIGEGSLGEKTGQGDTEMHSGFGHSTSQGSCSEGADGVRRSKPITLQNNH